MAAVHSHANLDFLKKYSKVTSLSQKDIDEAREYYETLDVSNERNSRHEAPKIERKGSNAVVPEFAPRVNKPVLYTGRTNEYYYLTESKAYPSNSRPLPAQDVTNEIYYGREMRESQRMRAQKEARSSMTDYRTVPNGLVTTPKSQMELNLDPNRYKIFNIGNSDIFDRNADVGKMDNSGLSRIDWTVFRKAPSGRIADKRTMKRTGNGQVRGGLGGFGEARQIDFHTSRPLINPDFQNVNARIASIETRKTTKDNTAPRYMLDFRNVNHGMITERPHRVERVTSKMPFAFRNVLTKHSQQSDFLDRDSIHTNRGKKLAQCATKFRQTVPFKTTLANVNGNISTSKTKKLVHYNPRFQPQNNSMYDFTMRGETERFRDSLRPAIDLIEPRLTTTLVGRKTPDFESVRLLK